MGDAMNGGKADNLARLRALGFPVPPWAVIGPETPDEALADLIPQRISEAGIDDAAFFAVRSSASAEDGGEFSFAGQFQTRLAVPREELLAAIRNVRASLVSNAALAYCRERDINPSALRMHVVVQKMVDASASGVAFAVDLATGSRRATTISAVIGLGEGLVSERAEADTFVVRDNGISATVVEKNHAVRFAPGGGVATVQLPDAMRTPPALADADVRRIADAVRRISSAFGRPQDVEWALTATGELWFLQTRPITTLSSLPDPDEPAVLWDNSNIVESYPGVTLPLTFSFARSVYSAVYRQFCLALGVEPSLLAANPDAFEMLGHWRGRLYYNLRNWYRVLMMLPGYRINAGFMEAMMGVKQPLRDKPTIRPSRRPEWLRVLSTSTGILIQAFTLQRRVHRFVRRFNAVVGPLEERDFAELPCAELVAIYAGLEREFIARWRTPLVNDFFAMVAYGALKKVLVKWGVDPGGTLQNDILVGVGDIISAEPMRRLSDLADAIRATPALQAALACGDDAEFLDEIKSHSAFAKSWMAYLRKFGARCMGELKLETITYDMDPRPLVAMLRSYASAPPHSNAAPHEPDLSALRGHPLRRFLFRRLRAAARRCVSNRENLRFERTRLFAIVRRLMLAFGSRLADEGFLDAPRDVFYLTFEEVFGFATGSADASSFRGLAAIRKEIFARYAAGEPPPERFETRGGAIVPAVLPSEGGSAATQIADVLSGIGCCRGVVRGTVKVIRDLDCPGETNGRILVAERTDPGWGPLFPLAKGVIVERGSVLSHAAILTRELGIPCVVGVKGLLASVSTGDLVELDGARGFVRILERSCRP